MPYYEYTALTEKGKKITGVIDADSPRELRSILLKQNIYLIQYLETLSVNGKKAVVKGLKSEAEGTPEVKLKKIFERIKPADIAVMTRQFGTLLKAGISMIESLQALCEQQENEKLRSIMTNIKIKVNEGSSLADALGEHKKVFPELYVNMVRVGEATGTLDLIFLRLAEFMESHLKLRSKLISAMIYPVLLFFVGFLIVNIMMLFVIPRVTEMFEEMGTELPILTKILIGVSNIFGKTWFIIIPLLILGFFWFKKWKKSERGTFFWDTMMLKLPVFGNLIRTVALSRFARTLSTLLQSGVPILTAMEIVKTIVNNKILANAIEEAKINIREGQSIAEPLKKSSEFPPMVTHMIAIGEKTAQLEDMLKNVADAYDTQVDSRITALTAILEPVMIVAMGLMVAFLVFAILLPMLKMNEVLQGR